MARESGGPRLKRNRAGVWYIHWQDGRSRRLSTRTKDRKIAEQFLAGFLSEKRDFRAEPLTVAWGWDVYWREHVEQHVVDHARLRAAWDHLRPHFGALPAEDIEPGDVLAYRRDRKAASSTVRRELGALIACLRHLEKTRRIGRAPYIPLPRKAEPKDRWLTKDEIACLEAAAEDGHWRARVFIAIALATGARRSSIEQLLWSQVDFDRRLIDFNGGRLRTKKRRPVVPISDKLLDVLAEAWLQRRGEYVLGHSGAIRTAFRSVVEQAGLKDVTPHTLRHTYATHAAMNGIPLVDIARVLGNTVAVVEQTYSKWAPEYLTSAVNNAYG